MRASATGPGSGDRRRAARALGLQRSGRQSGAPVPREPAARCPMSSPSDRPPPPDPDVPLGPPGHAASPADELSPRLAFIIAELRRRLRDVCADMSEDDFETMTERMGNLQYRYEMQLEHDGP
jgi:hypothetical protein